jgi:hypothetical protein
MRIAVVNQSECHGNHGYEQHPPPPPLGPHVRERVVRVFVHAHLYGQTACDCVSLRLSGDACLVRLPDIQSERAEKGGLSLEQQPAIQ